MGWGRGQRGRWSALAGALLAGVLVLGEGAAPAVSAAPLGLPLQAVLLTVVVTPPAATVATGATQQFTATGTYSDLSTHDITASVSWTSSDAAVATVSNAAATKGRATGVAAGGVLVTATDTASGLSGAAILAVTEDPLPPLPATLLAVVVSPTATSVATGATQQFTATGTYSDLTTQDLTATATWSTSDAAVATVSNGAGAKGRATGVAAGLATITATDNGGTAGSAALTVTPPIVLPPILPPVTPSPSTARALTLTPSTGGPFTEVRIKGVNFPINRRIRVQYETGMAKPKRIRLCKTMTTSGGAFTCYANIPGDMLAGRAGAHPVVAKILRRPRVAPVRATFTLVR